MKIRHADGSYEISPVGVRVWKNDDGLTHRIDGPAKLYSNGDEEWWLNGYLHRENRPASIHRIEGYFGWYKHGRRHRIDGPAVVQSNNDIEWHYEGKHLPLNEIEKWLHDNDMTVPLSEDQQLLFLLRWA